ncbi:uncharacterized protein PAC_08772 [Phialocephala subalpina]|uniref:DUF7703 domain-containing protein n=1 Tax=Phialocephala subalpina TaxID=576137 RepID=A0A1L7X1J4_9HELO|nr:uncharacterized protein PAC_08772 [Phialocephala subalpina]
MSDHGLTGGVSVDLPVLTVMVAFSTIALYNVLELNVIIFATFKRRKGLYFWSFIVATWGIVPHTVGFIFKFFDVTSVWWAPLMLVSPGWFAMVSGQSLVLYSRLHLVVRSGERIRWVLYLIIFNAIVVGIPDMILAFLTNRPGAPASIVNAFSIFDKTQVTIYFVQESIISALYIYETVRLLGPGQGIAQNPYRKLLRHLILINILVLVFDATLLGTEYSGNFEIQTTYKPAIYSVKLKIEFSVLNRLVSIVKNKEFASLSNPSHNTNSLPLHDFTNTAHYTTAHNGSMGDSIKDDEQPRVMTTELVSGPTDWNDQAMRGGRIGETRDAEREIRVSESQVQLAAEYQRH